MILGPRELQWEFRVEAAAHEHGWAVFRQSPAGRSANQRVPSLVLVRSGRPLLVFLRLTARTDRRPPVEQLAAVTGCPVVLWTPDDWTGVVATLRIPPGDLTDPVVGPVASARGRARRGTAATPDTPPPT